MHRYHWDAKLGPRLEQVAGRVHRLRQVRLPTEAAAGLRDWFRLQHAYHSNAIAGNRLTLPETRALMEGGATIPGKSPRDHSEAANLSQALDFIESLASTRLPLEERDLRNLHAVLLGTLDPLAAGVYRSAPARQRGGGLTPPEAPLVPEQMRELCAWLASERTEPPPVLACTAHAWFAAIQPFADGNGRMGRLLASLLLARHGYPLSVLRVKDKARYHNALKQAHAGDLTSLVVLTLEGLEQGLARYEHVARELEAPESPTPARRSTPPDPREFPLWRRGVESLLDALEHVARRLTEKHSGSSADLSLSLVLMETLTLTSWERAWKAPVPLAVLFGQSPQGTFDATLRASCPEPPRPGQRILPALSLHVAGAASPSPEPSLDTELDEHLFTAASATSAGRQEPSAQRIATTVWTYALERVLSRPR